MTRNACLGTKATKEVGLFPEGPFRPSQVYRPSACLASLGLSRNESQEARTDSLFRTKSGGKRGPAWHNNMVRSLDR